MPLDASVETTHRLAGCTPDERQLYAPRVARHIQGMVSNALTVAECYAGSSDKVLPRR